jgi:hypothetical protein
VSTEIQPAPLLRPWWQRARLWLGIAAVVVIGAILVGTLSEEPGRPLDPASTHGDGSKALVRVLEHFGATVTTTRSTATAIRDGAHGAIVVTAPNDYSDTQLQQLAEGAARLVLVRPGTRAAAAMRLGIEPEPDRSPNDSPGCADPGATTAGTVSLPGDALAYLVDGPSVTSCYGGALLTAPQLVVLGAPALLQNDHLGRAGVAALDANTITDSRRLTSVVWLTPGADTNGPGPASVWDLFPPAAYRAFWWLLAVGVLLALWRARRLGGVVSEPLPVVVRSAELVEGHGRLYARAGARERAATALREAVLNRMTQRLGLPRGASAEQVATTAAPIVGQPPGDVLGLLAGPPPTDDTALTRLVHDLDQLEAGLQEGERNR